MPLLPNTVAHTIIQPLTPISETLKERRNTKRSFRLVTMSGIGLAHPAHILIDRLTLQRQEPTARLGAVARKLL